jgi:hypothetical protein
MLNKPVKSPRADLLIGFEIGTAAVYADETACLDEPQSGGVGFGEFPDFPRHR